MKIEAGKKYVLRNGVVVGPLVATGDTQFPFAAEDAHGRVRDWRGDGRYAENGAVHSRDIIAEYPDPRLPSNSPTPRPRIVQILMTPNDAQWQGRLLGLGDDGVTYYEVAGEWRTFISAL